MLSWLDANALSMLNGVALAAVLFLIAVGLSLVFGTMDVLNLAHGAVSLTGAYIGVAFLGRDTTIPLFLTAVLAAALALTSCTTAEPGGSSGAREHQCFDEQLRDDSPAARA